MAGFSSKSFWNRELPAEPPLVSDSSNLVATLKEKTEGTGSPWLNTTSYSTGVFIADFETPTVEVELVENYGPTLQEAWKAVPIPAGATPAAGTDKHMVVYQPSTDRMWEFWLCEHSGEKWTAHWGGAMEGLSSDKGYFDSEAWPGAGTNWGATATSLPLMGGLMMIEEALSGTIPHALALAIPEPKDTYVFPAQRGDGYGTGAYDIPEGSCFRLRADYNIDGSGASDYVKMIMRAAQAYGMIVRDASGVVVLYGEAPQDEAGEAAWETVLEGSWPETQVIENLELAGFPWEELEVVDLRALTEEREEEEEGASNFAWNFESQLSGGNATTAEIERPTGAIVGEMMYAFFYVYGGEVDIQELGLSGEWTLIHELRMNKDSSDRLTVGVFERRATGSEPSTYALTWVGTAIWREGFILTLSGALTTGSSRAGTPNTANPGYTTSFTLEGMTTTVDHAFVAAWAIASYGTGIAETPAGYIHKSGVPGFYLVYKEQPSAGPTGSISWSGSEAHYGAGIFAVAPG
ncbi:MAG: hypothetical protein QM729_02750 [Solirubrobacterales bacterium]